MRTPNLAPLLILLSLATTPLLAIAQATMEDSTSLSFEAPYGMRDAGDMEMMVNGTRDGALNKVVQASPGWGFSASAIGNLVNVVTTGSNNTVVLNTNQINKGSQQAILATPLTGHNITGSGRTIQNSNTSVANNGATTDLR